MKNIKAPQYTSPNLEIITFECNDIVTTSSVPDKNEDGPDW